MAKKTGQLGRLLNWLETHPEGISQLEAFNALGICRLSERCRELAALGYVLSHMPEKAPNGARIIRYKLISSVNDQPTNDVRQTYSYAKSVGLPKEFPL